MTPRFFGQYLIAVGAITEAQLDAATRFLAARNLSLGARAVSAGFMTEQQVHKVTQLQRSVDARWGELCMTLGMLNRGQLEQLLAEQRAQSMRIGEALVCHGVLSAADRDQHLLRFLEHELLITNPHRGENNAAGSDEASNVVALLTRLALRTAGLTLKPGLTSAWSSEREFKISAAIPVESPSFGTLIGLSLDKELAGNLAAGLLGIEPDELDESMIVDGVCEFLNILAGHCKNSRQNDGEMVKLGLPTSEHFPNQGLAYALESPQGRGALVLNIEASVQALAA